MRFVIQRVKSSRLEVDGELVSEIGRGYNVFLGVTKGDTMDNVQKCARRIATVRLFKDDTTDKLQYNISQVGGEILLVSNFTLCDKKGSGGARPDFTLSADKETAITTMYMNEKMDEGDIILQSSTSISLDDTTETLHDRLSIMGRDLILDAIPKIVSGNINRIKQNEDEVTYAYNIKREEEKIDFSKPIKEVFNRIRGLNPYPGAYAKLNNKIVKIYDVEYTKNIHKDKQIGQIIKADKNGIIVSLKDGELIIKSLQIEGKKKTSVKEFINGNIKIENEVFE